MAVEKLAHQEFAEIASRQEALQTIFLSLLDIFYQPIFDFFQKKRVFQQPPLLSTGIRHENVNDADQLAQNPAFQLIGSASLF